MKKILSLVLILTVPVWAQDPPSSSTSSTPTPGSGDDSAAKPGLVEPIKPEEHQGPGRVGIQLEFLKSGYPRVADLIQGGPAYDAGVLYGDVILRIDKNNTLAMTQDEIRLALHGDANTGVDLYIQRNDEAKPRVFVLKRRVLPLDSVKPLRPVLPGQYYNPTIHDVPLPFY